MIDYKFNYLKTISMLGVVWIHVSSNFNSTLSDFASNYLFSSAVPLFFLLSAFFLFKKNLSDFQVFSSEVFKRRKTLLVPYVVWNMLILCLSFLLLHYFPSFSNGGGYSLSSPDIKGIISAILGIDRYPIHYQFWFLRNLMLLVVASYIIRKLLDFNAFLGVLIAALLDGYWPGTLFFVVGGCMALNRWDYFFNIIRPILLSVICFLLLLVLYFCDIKGLIVILTSLLFVISLSNIKYVGGESWLVSHIYPVIFFIYASHEPLITLCFKFLYKFELSRILGADLDAILVFIFVIAIGVSCGMLMKNKFNCVYRVLTGDR